MKLFLFTYLLFLFSCQTKPKIYKVYKGFEIPTTRTSYKSLADTLYNSDNAATVALEYRKLLRAFFDNLASKNIYITLAPKVDGNIVTGYRFYFIGSKTEFELLSYENSQNDDYEKIFSNFTNPETSGINTDLVKALHTDLSSKYGQPKLEASTEPLARNDGSVVEISIQTFIWEKEDLEIKLHVRTMGFYGTMGDGFMKINLDYDLSNNYKTRNKAYIEELNAQSSNF